MGSDSCRVEKCVRSSCSLVIALVLGPASGLDNDEEEDLSLDMVASVDGGQALRYAMHKFPVSELADASKDLLTVL